MFRHHRTRPREIPVRALVPNLLTTVALCAGLASLHFSVRGDWDRALAAIVVSAVFDALDGRAARILHVSSPFGAVLDSLSDFLSFGVAPAMILHQWMLKDEEVFGLAAVTTFALCSALRLARFTAAAQQGRTIGGSSRFFVGMPTPAAAGAVLIPPMLAASDTINWTMPAWGVVLHTFFIAWLMISRQPMFSFKKVTVRRRLVAPILVLVGLVLVLAIKDAWLAGTGLAAAYLLTLPLSILSYRRLRAAGGIEATPPLPIAPSSTPPEPVDAPVPLEEGHARF